MRNKIAPLREAWSRRPRFSPKQLLDAERLNAGLDDGLERQRLLNRAMYGTGVVFGYGVTTHDGRDRHNTSKCLDVSCGLAFDRHGRILYWPGSLVGVNDVEGAAPKQEGLYTLFVHFAERAAPPQRSASCSPTEQTWTEQGVVFSIESGCEALESCCPEMPGDECLDHSDFVRRRIGSAAGPPGLSPDLQWACERPGPMTHTECGDWCYDPDAGIPIACIEICDVSAGHEEEYERPDRRQRKPSGADSPCLEVCRVASEEATFVPHVYRNPLLRELIDCCDVALPRVTKVSWEEWLTDGPKPVPWDDFSDRILADDPDDGFSVWFSKPIRTATLHAGSAILTAIPQETRTDYWIPQRVPLREVRPLDSTSESGVEYASGAQLLPDRDWLAAEVTGSRSTLYGGARFEFTIRGQLLRDACGQMLDGQPGDIDRCARCQGRPGDHFLSVFEVGYRDRESERPSQRPRTEYQTEGSTK